MKQQKVFIENFFFYSQLKMMNSENRQSSSSLKLDFTVTELSARMEQAKASKFEIQLVLVLCQALSVP